MIELHKLNDLNRATRFASLDHRFGVAVQPHRRWPGPCSVVGDGVPDGSWKQRPFPFRWHG